MAARYFSQTPICGDRALLVGPEAHHLIHVMRARPGSRVVLFDGSGAEFVAQVEQVDRSEVQLAVLSRQQVDRELPVEVVLGVSLPKGERQRWLVEKAVELGAARIVPLVTARSVAQPVQQALRRLRRTVVEASKQCGRNRLLKIAKPQAWADYVADTVASPRRLLAQPHGRHTRTECVAGVERSEPPVCHPWGRPGADGQPPAARPGPVCLAVGPEGGFTGEEVSLAVAAGWRPVDLGPRILRVETAAILLTAMVARLHSL